MYIQTDNGPSAKIPCTALIPRFSYGAWEKLFPDKTQEDRKEDQKPLCVSEFILSKFSSIDMEYISQVKVIPLDGNYLE